MANKCIVSLAIGSPISGRGLYKALVKTISGNRELFNKYNPDVDYIFWDNNYPPDSPSHEDVPYAFKGYCLADCRRKGYDLVLWTDASVVPTGSMERIFNTIEEAGYIFFKGWGPDGSMGGSCSDDALAAFGITRAESFKIPSAIGTIFGLDLRSTIANKFLDEYFMLADKKIPFTGLTNYDGKLLTFRRIKWNSGNLLSQDPRVKGYRWDQTVMSFLIHKLNLTLTPTTDMPFVINRQYKHTLRFRLQHFLGKMLLRVR